MQERRITGFSKLDKAAKLRWLINHWFDGDEEVADAFRSFWHQDPELQSVFDGFSENTVSNYWLPLGIAPNFLIDDRMYAVPMVIEESSVVAAASSAAKFWLRRGGFRTRIVDTVKLGQVHFTWKGDCERLRAKLPELERQLRAQTASLTANMEKRGGGIEGIELLDFTGQEPDYYQLRVRFQTCDSMGANFINSVLESFARTLKTFVANQADFTSAEQTVDIIMAILSNYTPECLVRAEVTCSINELEGACAEMKGQIFAEKFAKAVRIAQIDPYRAVTHNKGIYNGVDAVVIATANDFRAIEASGHAFATRNGQYASLSSCTLESGRFRFWLDLPLAVGTVGGLTRLHPLAKLSLALLGNPGASELMSIIAATGLAQNFAAVRSLVTTGIQKGHMKMHLQNILQHFHANESERKKVMAHFENTTVSFTAVREYLERLRRKNGTSVLQTAKK